MLSHVIRLARSGQLRFRAETFGLFYPSFPDIRPWWRLSPRSAVLLLRSIRSYRAWRRELATIAGGTPRGWWRTHAGYFNLEQGWARLEGECSEDVPGGERGDGKPEAQS